MSLFLKLSLLLKLPPRKWQWSFFLLMTNSWMMSTISFKSVSWSFFLLRLPFISMNLEVLYRIEVLIWCLSWFNYNCYLDILDKVQKKKFPYVTCPSQYGVSPVNFTNVWNWYPQICFKFWPLVGIIERSKSWKFQPNSSFCSDFMAFWSFKETLNISVFSNFFDF